MAEVDDTTAMTDQPLPLKPWDTEMDEELEKILAHNFERAEGRGWGEGVQEVYAYCWKLLAEKEAENKQLIEGIYATKIVQDLKSEMDSLRQLKQIAQEAMAKNFEVIEEKEAELKAYIDQVNVYHAKVREQAETVKILTEALERTLAALISYKHYIPEPYKQNPIYIIGAHEAEKLAIAALDRVRDK